MPSHKACRYKHVGPLEVLSLGSVKLCEHFIWSLGNRGDERRFD
jgi:hypothetical protein